MTAAALHATGPSVFGLVIRNLSPPGGSSVSWPDVSVPAPHGDAFSRLQDLNHVDDVLPALRQGLPLPQALPQTMSPPHNRQPPQSVAAKVPRRRCSDRYAAYPYAPCSTARPLAPSRSAAPVALISFSTLPIHDARVAPNHVSFPHEDGFNHYASVHRTGDSGRGHARPGNHPELHADIPQCGVSDGELHAPRAVGHKTRLSLGFLRIDALFPSPPRDRDGTRRLWDDIAGTFFSDRPPQALK